VARVVYTDAAARDLERLIDFLLEQDPPGAVETADLVLDAISMLEKHPLLGRPASENLHELVISRGRSGYLALYDYEPFEDLILILAIRHQREAGYADPSAQD
jgi:plasmid stabilization system protein ParE